MTSSLQRIDADVHVRWPNDETLLPRLSRNWHERWLEGAGHTHPGMRIHSKHYNPLDAFTRGAFDSANPRAVDCPSRLAAEWLNPHRLDAAVVSVYDSPVLSTFGDIDYPTELARAVNDWLVEEWLDAEPRLLGSLVVATQDPIAAAAEIRRTACHPRMVQLLLPTGTRLPYGHRFYNPILEAAEECGLAIAIHAGTEGIGTSCPPSACGWPTTFAEMRVARSTVFLAHLTSLITEGSFVRFPRLKVIGLEAGIAWLPTYLWRFDKNYKGLRSECPWLKELPSDYVRHFFRFGTQSAEPGEPTSEFWRLLKSSGVDDLLLFSSNYPRWDAESPDESYVLSTCPDEKRTAIWAGNALATYPRLAEMAIST